MFHFDLYNFVDDFQLSVFVTKAYNLCKIDLVNVLIIFFFFFFRGNCGVLNPFNRPPLFCVKDYS